MTDAIQQDLESIRQRLQPIATTTGKPISIDAQPVTVQESEPSELKQKLDEYREKLGAPSEISDVDLLTLIAENEFIPDQPTHTDRRPLPVQFKSLLEQFDSRYFSWADTKAGKAIAMLLIILTMAALIFPSWKARQYVYNQGYQACQSNLLGQ